MRALILYCFLLVTPFAVFAEQVPDSIAKALQKRKEFAYANDPSYWAAEKPADTSGLDKLFIFLATSPFMKWVGYIILGLIIILIIYQVAIVNNFFIFSRSKKKKQDEQKKDDELTPEDIDEKINAAINTNNYREAVRYLHLKTIYVLHASAKIVKHKESTNQDYLKQMHNTPAYNDFALLTRIYEYVWYGEFQPAAQQFEKIHNNFNRFISRN